MLSLAQAAIMGALQGLTELFPISSLGHSVILPTLLGWHIDQRANEFLLFLVATHFATAAVLFGIFWKDWMRIMKGILRSLAEREIKATDVDAKLGWLLIVATIPAGVLGLLFEEQLKTSLGAPQLVAAVLIVNGLLLLVSERFERALKTSRTESITNDGQIAKLSWKQGLTVGALQCLALIPGFSRTGSTMTGGLLVGLDHEDAARFSFLLATPIIGAASLLKLPELLKAQEHFALAPIVVGMICAAIFAYSATRFLSKYFETKTLRPFGYYCLVAGVLFSALLLWR